MQHLTSHLLYLFFHKNWVSLNIDLFHDESKVTGVSSMVLIVKCTNLMIVGGVRNLIRVVTSACLAWRRQNIDLDYKCVFAFEYGLQTILIFMYRLQMMLIFLIVMYGLQSQVILWKSCSVAQDSILIQEDMVHNIWYHSWQDGKGLRHKYSWTNRLWLTIINVRKQHWLTV